jgi:hypothetical protein
MSASEHNALTRAEFQELKLRGETPHAIESLLHQRV